MYLVGHDDLVAFGSVNTKILTSDAGVANNFALSTVMDCNAGLYAGETIHTPAPAE